MTKFLFLLPMASAFVVHPGTRPIAMPLHYRTNDGGVESSVTSDIDLMMRAQECANEMGICSLDEVAELRDAIHDARVRNMFMDNIPPSMEDQLILQRTLEDDLSLQLHLLQEEELSDSFSLFQEGASVLSREATTVVLTPPNSTPVDYFAIWQYMMVM